MKKNSTFLFLLAFFVAGSLGAMKAQEVPSGFYKKFHVVENFDERDVMPAGWTVLTNNSSHMGRNGGIALAAKEGTNKWLSFSGSGSGSRGAQLTFPSTNNYPAAEYPSDSIWFVQFDWTIPTTAASLSAKNAAAIFVSGSGGVATNDPEGWYFPSIFGLYVWKNGGYLHYMNMDRDGLQKRDQTTGELIAGETNGQAFLAGNWQSWTRATSTSGAPVGTADSLNATTATKVVIALGGTYRIHAKIDLKASSQKVLQMTITDLADPANTDVIGEMAFLAPTHAGTAATVAREQRIVKDISLLNMINTRGSNGGNGNSSNLANSGVDNMEIYLLQPSLGQRDVTINYVDRDGGKAKDSRVVPLQEVGNPYRLINADKLSYFNDAHTFYYAYDAELTHAANSAKGEDGESVVVSLDGDNSITVVFKKTAVTAGEYVWTGEAGFNWDELENNFSVGGTPSIGYQSGNAVTFSGADVLNKEVQLPLNVNLGAGDLTVSASGYSISGAGRISGTGTLIIDKGTTIGVYSGLEGGALVNTTEPVHIKNAGAATHFKVVDNATLILEANADFNKPIEAEGTLNVECVSNNIYAPAITNASTINILMSTLGSHNANWRSAWRTILPEGAQINVSTNMVDLARPVGFGVEKSNMKLNKLHLGDSIRLLRDYNERNANPHESVMEFGEITGTEKSFIEGGFVDGRASRISVGHLNTDAVFNGQIRQYLLPTEEEAFSTSTLELIKLGTGKWTVNGDLSYSGELFVQKYGGTLELGGNVAPSVTTISVDTAGVFIGKNITVESTIKVNIGTIGGSFTANSISLTGSKIKMNVNSFNEGDYDQIKAVNDFEIIKAEDPSDLNILDITVVNAEKDKIIDLLLAGIGKADVFFDQVLVNGVNVITGYEYVEDEATGGVIYTPIPNPDADYVYGWDVERKVATLKSKVSSSVDNVFDGKTIQSIQLYDITGRVLQPNSKGLVIKQITFTDGTRTTEKVFINKR